MSRLLQHYGLRRNPFIDRTAEKTDLDPSSLYLHSDLQGFAPSSTTYLFFGKRGSGKTTIRKQMEAVYDEHNRTAQQPFFKISLCEPGHLNDFLNTYRLLNKIEKAAWDATFYQTWHATDMIDCMVSMTITRLLDQYFAPSSNLEALLLANRKAMIQFLLLSHLYGKVDSATLFRLRWSLLRKPQVPPTTLALQVAAVAVPPLAVAVFAKGFTKSAAAFLGGLGRGLLGHVAQWPVVGTHPKLSFLGGVGIAAATFYLRARVLEKMEQQRVAELTQPIRVVDPSRHISGTAALVHQLFAREESAATIRSMYVGTSSHQKLELLESLIKTCNYAGLAKLGDFFDEVELLDPVVFPNAIKRFAQEICRNDILNFGRMHFFFPDTRMNLDLNTDTIAKEARFDRHFVRDLNWSRQQLQDLAERRFMAFQQQQSGDHPGFRNMFELVKLEDFSSSLAKLRTPRQLFICLTELMQRMEAHQQNDFQAYAQDIEYAVAIAQEQAN